MSDPAPRDGQALDIRLVPAALTGWLMSALGILTPAGPASTALCALIAAAVALVVIGVLVLELLVLVRRP